MSSRRADIVLQDVCFEIQGAPILEGINWEVPRGERWVLLGPNGSGKTTLLSLITGYSYPSRGRVEILGNVFGFTDLREMRRKIGWVHGDLRHMIPEFMTVEAVVIAGKRGSLVLYENCSRAEKKAASGKLELVEADGLISRRFATLSTGERQRVLIARALIAEPEILLLDEPCLGLDPGSRESFLKSLASFFADRADLTVVTVTHHVEEIMENYHGVCVLDRGKIVTSGRLGETLNSGLVSTIFGENCRISFSGGRYYLSFQ